MPDYRTFDMGRPKPVGTLKWISDWMKWTYKRERQILESECVPSPFPIPEPQHLRMMILVIAYQELEGMAYRAGYTTEQINRSLMG